MPRQRARVASVVVVGALAATLLWAAGSAAPAGAQVACNNQATVTATPTTVAPGQAISVNLSGYNPNSIVTLADNGNVFAQQTVDNTGSRTGIPYTVPTAGTHTIQGIDAGGRCGQTVVTATGGPAPANGGVGSLSVTPTTASPGQTFSISGNGFAGNETVFVFFDNGSQIATANAAGGGFTTTAVVPNGATNGTHTVNARGNTSGVTASATINVTNGLPNNTGPTSCSTGGACLYNNTPSAPPGGQVTVSGTGYGPNETVIVSADNGSPVANGYTDPSGRFLANGTVPINLTPGQHTITGVGQTTGRTDSDPLTVTGTPCGTIYNGQYPYANGAPYTGYNPSTYPYGYYGCPNGPTTYPQSPYPQYAPCPAGTVPTSGVACVAPPAPTASAYPAATSTYTPAPATYATAAPAVQSATPVSSSQVPFTGSHTTKLVAIALSLVFGGLLLLSGRFVVAGRRQA